MTAQTVAVPRLTVRKVIHEGSNIAKTYVLRYPHPTVPASELYRNLSRAIRKQALEDVVGVAFVYEWDKSPWFDFQVFRNPEASFSDIDLKTKVDAGFGPGNVMCTVQATILGRESELLMSNTDSFKTTFPKLPDIRPYGVRIFPKKYC